MSQSLSMALIGHSGFVGGNLLRQAHFDASYRGSDIETIAGRSFDVVVCAGAPAAKWIANAKPAEDMANLERLMAALAQVQAGRVVLLSTIDVLSDPNGADEHTPFDPEAASAYGRHRHRLETFVQARFPTLTVRLPGLFGPGLKKNAVYDLLHGNQTEKIHADDQFQFYDLRRLWADLTRCEAAGLDLVHFATEPVRMRDVAKVAFGIDFDGYPPRDAVRYDFRTCHAGRLGGGGGYLYDRATVLADLAAFVASERGRVREVA